MCLGSGMCLRGARLQNVADQIGENSDVVCSILYSLGGHQLLEAQGLRCLHELTVYISNSLATQELCSPAIQEICPLRSEFARQA